MEIIRTLGLMDATDELRKIYPTLKSQETRKAALEAAGAWVTWIGNVDDTAGLDWLEDTARSAADDGVGGSALFAMALHRSRAASTELLTR